VQHENLWLFAEHCLVECRHDVVDLIQLGWGAGFLFGTVIDVLEDLFLLFRAEDFLDDADWGVVLGFPWWKLLGKLVNYSLVDEDLASQSEEFCEPGFADDFTVHSGFECVFSQFIVLLLVSESSKGSVHSEDEISGGVTFKCVSRSFLCVPQVLDNRVFKSSSLESDNWCTCDEELMLDNTTWFENRWHKSKIGSSIDKISISEEVIWCGPEAIWIFVSQTPHLMSASSRVRLSHIGWSSNQELNFEFKFVNDMLGNVKN
jgi:hypothetical protein